MGEIAVYCLCGAVIEWREIWAYSRPLCVGIPLVDSVGPVSDLGLKPFCSCCVSTSPELLSVVMATEPFDTDAEGWHEEHKQEDIEAEVKAMRKTSTSREGDG